MDQFLIQIIQTRRMSQTIDVVTNYNLKIVALSSRPRLADRINWLMYDDISILSLELHGTVESCESTTNKTNVLPAGITSVKLNNR